MSDPHEIATWRFEQIAPFVDSALSEAQKKAALRERTTHPVEWPRLEEDDKKGNPPKKKPISRSAIYRWLKLYEKKGYPGLVPKTRQDKGKVRTSVAELVLYALGLLYEQSNRSLTQLVLYLSLEFPGKKISRSALSRHLHAHPAYEGIERLRNAKGKKLRDLYETTRPHEIWQLDGKGPFEVRLVSGKRIHVHVLSILDDYSRAVLAAQVATSEDLAAAVKVFRNAAARYGLSDRFQFDRGSAFESKAFRAGIAMFGVRRNWVKVRNPEAQGKIEAYHRSLARWFIKELPHQEIHDLEHLQELLEALIALLYNRHYHRKIKTTPEKRLAGRISDRRVSLEDLTRNFRVEIHKKSHHKTGQVSLPNGLYRVPSSYAGRRCTFRYDPAVNGLAYLIGPDDREIKLEPFQEKRPFARDHTPQEKRGIGQLQKLVDIWQGRERPNAQPGFGLPEVFREIGRLLERPVPSCEKEAMAITAFYHRYGPLPREPFLEAIEKTRRALGGDRPLKAYLQHLERLIRSAQSDDPENEKEIP